MKASVTQSLKAKQGRRSDQGKVWEEVAALQDAHGVESPTGAMSDTFDAYEDQVAEYREELKYVDSASGMAVALSDKIVGCDQFDKPSEKQRSQAQSNPSIALFEDDGDIIEPCDDQNQQEQNRVFPWTCKKCGEQVPGTFEVCWKCGTTKVGLEDSKFVTEYPDVGENVEPKNETVINCPDCDGSLREIQIIDKGGDSLSHHDLEYAAADAERSFWMSRYPVAGKITAYMCQECGVVRLFGHSHD